MSYNILTLFRAATTQLLSGWLRSVCTTLIELATSEGFRFGHTFDVTLTTAGQAGDTKYFLYLNPTAPNLTMALQERRFKSLNGSAEMEILWDVESFTPGTLEETFNQRKDYSDGVVQISEIAAPVLGEDYKIREPDFLPGSGTGANSSGDIASGSGFRMYPPGSYFIFKVVNLHNQANRIIIAYDWLEIQDTVITP